MNPWNTKQNFEMDQEIVDYTKQWFSGLQKLRSCYRAEYLEKNPYTNEEYRQEIQAKYDEGYGYKLFARKLEIGYTECRTLFRYLDIKTRKGYDVVTDPLKKFRSERIEGEKNPWYEWPSKKPQMTKTSNTGLQGYLQLKDGSWIWIRSTWEFIYIRWMERNDVKFTYEPITILLPNGETYKPDFKINDEYYVEIKCKYRGNSRIYKPKMAIKELGYKIVIIDDVEPYCLDTYSKELKRWKQLKQKKLSA